MRKIYILLLSIICASGSVQAQISKFCFTATSGTYNQLSGGNSLNGIEDDDANVRNVPIGFAFNYMGTNYNQASVSSNGWLSFTNQNPSDNNSHNNNIATTTAGLVSTLYPLWDDLDGSNGTASYLTTGTSGNHIFTMEFRNWQWDYNASGNTISFQIKLYEGTNTIEFVYRPESGNVRNNSGGASIGLTDGTGGSGHYLSLNNSSANPAVSSTTATNNISAKPANGQIYRFTPSATPAITSVSPNPVCSAGATVTITGTNFNACLSAVSFNGTAATTFAYVNATTITATVPAGATSGTVSITTPGGTANSPAPLTIGSNGTIALLSGTASPVACINTGLTSIVYSIGGSATGATLTGSLPAGVTGSFSGGAFTIAGAPTSAGTFNYTVTTTGSGCTNPSLSGTITVNADAAISLSSAAGTDAQTKCINNAITNITYTIGGSATGATVSGLPPGVNGTYAAGVFTISGTATAAGTFSYTVETTGPCAKPSLNGTITVTDNGSIALSSAAGSNTQAVCLTNALTDITFAITGNATGASITAGSLPPGVSGSFNAGVFTISGTPTATGIYNYTVGTSGSSCINSTASGTITVNEDAIISLSSAAGTDAQILCALTPITDITYHIGGFGTTGATVIGLPAGITGSYNAGIFTITGSPTATGTFNYSVTATGPCVNASLNGSIVVNNNGTVTLSSITGTDNQSVCLGNAITDITYAIDPSATGASIIAGALPAGVTGSFAAGTFTITGTATVPGVFNYTVQASGSTCANLSASGTITINEDATISLSSATGTNAQTTCINSAITDISYSIAGFGTTGATVTGLPAGVNGTYAAGIFTVSGTPVAAGTFNYTVTTTGSCATPAATGSIIVNANSTITLSSGTANQTQCINAALTTVTYMIGGDATGANLTSGSFPAGVTGSFAAGVFTISGTPTASGVFPYSITTTGPCVNPTVSGTITVNADATISLPVPGTDVQTTCIGTTITNIAYAIGGGGTGATVSGLPAGVNGSYAAGIFTITGTPNTAGTFNYSVNTTGPCIKPSLGGTITVTANATIVRTSSAATAAQTVCINNGITNIIYTIGGSGTGATVTGLPAGVNGLFNAGAVTISGTPTVTGAFSYTVTTTGPCGNLSLGGTITVNADATIALTSTSTTALQTLCVSTAIANITYSIGGGGTGATVTGLPGGINGSYNSGTHIYTISGTATTPGTFNYTVTAAGPCIRPALAGTITVTANATITRTSSAATAAQTVCVNNNITNIIYTIGGSGTGATATGLPAGVNGTFNAGIFTISGAPTTSGTFSYSVTAIGPCATPSLNGTITVNADATISLTSAPATASQTKCINTAITNIIYSIGGGGTNAAVTGLPSGLSGSYNSGTHVFTISGAATVSGTFNYTVTPSGPCLRPSLGGTIIITANATISLSSATGTNIQTICTNVAITNIAYTIGGSGTGATVTGLPAGVTGTYNAGVYTLSGSPTISGTFTYVVTATGPCANPSLGGTLTVYAIPVGTLTATENSGPPNDNTICAGASVTFTATPGYGSYIFKINGSTAQSGLSNVFNTTSLANGASVSVDVANGLNCGTTFGPVVITVNALPSPALNADRSNICPGDVVTFTATGGASYTFNVNGTAVQSGTSNIFTSSTLTNGNAVTVTATNSSGCTAISAPIAITVNTLPSGTLNASATSICAGNNITFTATSGYSNYNFKVNGIGVQNGSSNIFSSTTLTNPSVVTVDVTNASNCQATFNPIVVTVNAVPTGLLTATENSGTANDNSICSGANVTFTATAGFNNYDFEVNGISQQNGPSNIYISSSLTNNDAVTVAATNGNNCTATFNSMLITVIPSPAGTLSASSTTICPGNNIDFTATPGFANYDFRVNGTTIQNGSSNTYSNAGFANGDVVTVEVTSINGCTATYNAISITVVALPAGSLALTENSGNAPDDGIICTGATIAFTAPAGYANYNFLLNAVSIQNGASNTYTNSSLVNGDMLTVAITNANGCIGLLNTSTITVNAYPVVSPITGTTAICVNETTALADVTPGGTWSSSNDSRATVDASGIVTGIAAGTAVISYTVTNANGCSTTENILVTIHGLSFVGAITGDLNICANTTTLLSNSVAGGTWSSDNTAVATIDASGLVTGISDGIAIISYSITNSNGCTKTKIATLTVNAPPVLNPVIGNLNVCIGNTSLLANDTDGGIWSSNNTSIATVNPSTGLVSGVSAGTATISYTVTDGNGCSATAAADISVWPLPVPTLTGPNPICPNSTGTYTTEPGQSSYIWTFTGGTLVSEGTSTDNSITILWDQPGPKTIHVNYTDANGCSASTAATVTTNTGTVASLSGPAEICLNADGSYLTDPGQSNYVWTVSGGNISSGGTATDNTATITWTTSGTGSVSINFTDPGGCIAASSVSLPVLVHTLPTAAVSGTTSVCQNAVDPEITFTGANGVAPYTFTYNINGGADQEISTVSGNSIAVPVPAGTIGSFVYNLVSVSDNNSCSHLQSASATITVNELPTGTISGTGTICQNNASPLVTFTGITGTAPFIFSYNINGGATQTITTASGNAVTIAAPTGATGSFVYNLLSVSDTHSCSQAQTGSATITVVPSPAATVAGTTSVCQNAASPNITFTGSNGTEPYIFTYNINGGSSLTITSAGNTAIVPVPTIAAGAFTYTLLSVQDAGANLCSQIQTGSVTVTVNLPSVGGTVGTDVSVCSGNNSGILTLTGNTGNITGWESSVDGGSTWTPIANSTATLAYTNLTTTTLYHAIVQSGVCSSVNSTAATITVDQPSVGGTVTSDATVCSGTNSGTLTLTGHTGAVIRWESSITGGSTWTPIANTTASQTYANLTQTTLYRAVVANGACSSTNAIAATITVNPLPTATVSGTASVCINAASPTITFTGADGTAPYTFTYKINGGSNLTAVSTGSVATVSVPTGTAGVFTYTLVSVQDAGSTTCSQNQAGSAVITVNALPAAFIITPASASVCQGDVQPLSASASGSSSGSVTFSSGTVNLSIPNPGNRANTLAVTGIPAGAVITGVNVNFNITHDYDNELVLNLTAPNGNTINLVNKRGGSGNNFTNTVISSTNVNPISGNAPFSNTYAADADNNVGTPNSNATAFSSLYGTPNGNWVFNAKDGVDCNGLEIFGACLGNSYAGTLNSWTITINYTVPNIPLSVSWSPLTDLYTDAGATTGYTGQLLSTVYVKPSGGNVTYTATTTNGAGCSRSQTASLVVGTKPQVSITADYCIVPGKVRITANAVPAATSYIWNTGAVTQSIDVDIAGSFDVTCFAGNTCPGTASINIAQELVTNGDFESGNTGFVSPPLGANQYHYVADGAANNELNPEGLYGIGPNANTYHPNFWGHDHTTGSSNFMIINGFPNGNPQPIVWQETVAVLPNTTYYFSAWAMSLNNAGPFASLQFNVNGAQVGTTAVLTSGQNNNTNNGWIRFYGTWTSGPSTTNAVISITDLQTAAGGNDFGLDDISFATLSTFIVLESAPGTDAQTVCANTPLTNIVYSVGNGSPTGPIVAGLPAGVTSVFSGDQVVISGTATVAGNYTYTLTTTGTCLSTTASGTINVQAQAIALSSGSAATTVCAGAAVNIGYTLSGTAAGATVTGLPAGVSGSLSGTAYTITGTATVAGSYPYTITTTGTCTPVVVNGTITVQSQTITLNSGNDNQTVCINNPIANIQYTVGGTGSGVSVSGLPAGVNFSYNSGIVFINGTPSVSGVFNYTVNTTGNCTSVSATGTINVTPTASLVLTSASGTNNQNVCRNIAITNITYMVNNATGATISGLPAGITGAFSAGVFTISGAATVNGTFNYTVTTSGGCGTGTATGTITIQSQTIALTSGSASPSVCINAVMTNIVYTIGGTATGTSVTGLPSGVTYSIAGNIVTVSGIPAAPGSFPYTVTTSGNCAQATANGTINVQPGANGGTVASVTICSGGSGTLTVTGQSGAIVRWEFSTNAGSTWTPIANTTITQTYNNITDPTAYRVIVNNGCGMAVSTVATIAIHNYWTGGTSSDWNTASNWADNQVPTLFCSDVHIKGGMPNQPLLGSGVAIIENLHIYPGAILTVDDATLKVSGTIFNNGTFISSNGSLELNSTSAQVIAPATFQNNALKNLIISNSSAAGVSLGGNLDIYRSLTFTGSGRKFNTGGLLTLKSTASETAWVGDLTGNTVTGDATVERYIGTGIGSAPNHGKSWQLLAVPTSGQTIKQAWQEGAVTVNGNPNPGFGTMLTSDVPNAATQPNPGFDVFTAPGPSIKTYNSANNTYVGPASTNIPLYNPKGYFILVRGDRSVVASNQAATPTVLRSKGTLFTPSNPPPVTNVSAGKIESVGNPYASALDLRNISKTGGVNEFFYVWDPRLGGVYNLGAYQTIFKVGSNYFAMPGGGSYGSGVNNFIQSGQAFLVQATGTNGTISFGENTKSNGSELFFRDNQLPVIPRMLKTNLYTMGSDGTASLADGVLNMFDDSYSNDIDGLDAKKSANTGENLSIKTNSSLLAIERKHTVISTDTIFLNLASVRAQAYRFEFVTSGLDNAVEGFVEDQYLNARTPLNSDGTTVVSFNVVNIPGSYAPDRFRIIFNRLAIVPVTFTSVKAYQHAKDINVEWKTENEINIQQYVVEKSLNGSSFAALDTRTPTGINGASASYLTVDEHPADGFNFYRIRSIDGGGKEKYSETVKVFIESPKPAIAIYPNPITNGIVNLQLINQPAGSYSIKLYNRLGQVIISKQITHAEGSSTEKIKWDYNLAHGMYLLEVIQPDGNKKVIKVLY